MDRRPRAGPAGLRLAAPAPDPWKIVGFSLHGLSLIMLLHCSAAHDGFDRGLRVNALLRTLDDTSVFGLIAGTVTPLVLVIFRNPSGWAVLGTV